MKKGLLVLALVFGLGFPSTNLLAQDSEPLSHRNHYLGIRISSAAAAVNHSITYKRYLDPTTAIEGLFSFTDPLALGILLEKYKPLGTSPVHWFYGAGAYVGFSGGRQLGAQGIVGLDFTAPKLPFNLTVDWKPELNFIKQFSFEPAAVGLSVRFVF